MTKNEHKPQIIETDPQGPQIMDLSETDFKISIIDVFKKLKCLQMGCFILDQRLCLEIYVDLWGDPYQFGTFTTSVPCMWILCYTSLCEMLPSMWSLVFHRCLWLSWRFRVPCSFSGIHHSAHFNMPPLKIQILRSFLKHWILIIFG